MKLKLSEIAIRKQYHCYHVLNSETSEKIGELIYFPVDEIFGVPKAKFYTLNNGHPAYAGVVVGEGAKERGLEELTEILSKPPNLPEE